MGTYIQMYHVQPGSVTIHFQPQMIAKQSTLVQNCLALLRFLIFLERIISWLIEVLIISGLAGKTGCRAYSCQSMQFLTMMVYSGIIKSVIHIRLIARIAYRAVGE